MNILKYLMILIPILLSACESNAKNDNSNFNRTTSEQEQSNTQKATSKVALDNNKKEKISVSICEPDYQPLNYCTPKFQKLLQEESKKSPNFDKNKRVIINKIQMKQNKKGIYEYYLAVIDLDSKKAYPLSQVATSFSDKKGYLISQQPKIDYNINSNQICFSGTLIGFQDSHNNVENACYEFEEQNKDILPINEPFTEKKVQSQTSFSNVHRQNSLPFTQQSTSSQITPLPFDSDLYIKCTYQPHPKQCESKIYFVDEAKLPEYAKSFSSSAERLILPNLSDGTQVFVSANAEGDDADVGSTVFIEFINSHKRVKQLTIEVGQSIKIDKNYQAKIYEYRKGKMRLIKKGYITDLAEDIKE